MRCEGKTETIKRDIRRASIALMSSAALVGCGSVSSTENYDKSSASLQSTGKPEVVSGQTEYRRVAQPPGGLRLMFYSLGDGTEKVRTFTHPGGGNIQPEIIREYSSGESAIAVCKAAGRLIIDATQVGVKREYADWILIKDDNDGALGYTSAVYAESPDSLLAQLDVCNESNVGID